MFRSLILSFIVAISTLGLGLPAVVQANEPQTVTLQVENMTCGSCPFTVKKALKQVDGVEKVSAKYEGRGEGWASITFDPAKTSLKNLIKATTDAGYPSHL